MSFPESSICGGRPGLKIRSLTLSEARSISRKTLMKFGGGGDCAEAGRCSWLFATHFSLELFLVLAASKLRMDERAKEYFI